MCHKIDILLLLRLFLNFLHFMWRHSGHSASLKPLQILQMKHFEKEKKTRVHINLWRRATRRHSFSSEKQSDIENHDSNSTPPHFLLIIGIKLCGFTGLTN